MYKPLECNYSLQAPGVTEKEALVCGPIAELAGRLTDMSIAGQRVLILCFSQV